jgi:hypothetical protein
LREEEEELTHRLWDSSFWKQRRKQDIKFVVHAFVSEEETSRMQKHHRIFDISQPDTSMDEIDVHFE